MYINKTKIYLYTLDVTLISFLKSNFCIAIFRYRPKKATPLGSNCRIVENEQFIFSF